MGNKKASRPPTSKTSSAAAPAASGATVAGNKSSVLRAAFSPSEYQLGLFASVIQGLDAQHLRIHDINTGRLQCEHAVAPKESITSLDWGYYHREREQQSKKKRKRNSGVNGAVDDVDGGDVVVAFGTSTSEIRMYSPIEDKVIATLSGGHAGGIKDFKFTARRSSTEGWSIGGDNKLVQWDLRTGRSIRTIPLPTTSVVSALSRPTPSNPPVICATQTPYIIDVEKSDEPPLTFPAMRNPIHTLISSSTDSIMSGHFLASDSDRYINIFDPTKKGLVMNLVAEKEVSSLSFYPGSKQSDKTAVPLDKQVLAVVVEDGTIELFAKPFLQLGESQGSKTATSLKAKAKQMTRRADALLKIVRPESGKLVSVVKTEFQGPELLVAWAEGGVNVIFERVRWQDQDTEELAFSGTKEVTGRKAASVLGSAAVNGARKAGQSQVDETNVVVESGRYAEDVEMNDSRDDAALVSSEDEEVSDEDSESREGKKASEKRQVARTKGSTDKDVEMQDAEVSEAEEEKDDGAEPSFGELLRANAPEAIDVEAELEDEPGAGPLVPGKANTAAYQIPSGVSLSTVLTQALRTNDNEMLESCFHTGDLNIIRTTIQRLDSSLAATLLQRLAERLAARPGRYGHLLVWVQWTCIAHGGAIAGKPDILKRMSALFKVMDQRSSSLPSLLLLKGKLDMLDAQLNLRQSTANRGADGMDSEDDEDIIYVEGQDDDSDAEGRKASAITPRTKSMRDTHGMLTDENDAAATPNGIASGLESDEDEEGSEDEAEEDENLVDIEAEESVGSSDAEESLEENEDDEEDEEDSDEGSAGSLVDFIADSEEELSDDDGAEKSPPPSKKAKLGGKGNKAGGRR
ncbi:hypothetical protein VTN77DRAFT_8973 [Rasamsonia byssochlamydoides]|uniref:uncharacterized protein n=1 Tax=Rasamsonia byssochlamydoides TaxID=89139 RepID=UPI003742B4EB